MRRLPETDLANFCVLTPEQQKFKLTNMVAGAGRHSLRPTRLSLSDILNAQPPLFRGLVPLPVTSFEKIESDICKRSKSSIECAFNLSVARLLYDNYRDLDVSAIPQDFERLRIGKGYLADYWIPAYFGRDGVPVVTFIDPRGGHGLTQAGMDVVFSLMSIGIRERVPGFENAILEIVRTPYLPKRSRSEDGAIRALKTSVLIGAAKYTYDELNSMVDVTLQLWEQAQFEFVERLRKRAG